MFSEDAALFVDADSIYFRIACTAKTERDIRKSINYSIRDLKRECMSNNILLAVKGEGNFRKDLYPQYKAHRRELDDELCKALNYGHKYICDHHGAVKADGMEADDLVSIWAYEAMAMGKDYTIAGIDKDLLQIPGQHYNFLKRQHIYVDADAGNLNLMLQCLTGDTADNIPGIRGIGIKRAQSILSGVSIEKRWDRVRATWRYHKAGDPTDTWRILKMLTSWEEYDEVRDQIASKTSLSQSHVLEERKVNKEN